VKRGVLLLALVSGCAAQHEEASRAESPPAADREYEDAPADEPEATPTAAGEMPPPSLEQLQLELAANNAKLRDLGVVIPVELSVEEQEPEEPDNKAGGGDGRGAATGTTAPAGQPPKPTANPTKSDRDREEKKKPRPDKAGDKTGAKAKDESRLDFHDDGAQPDAAKAAPPLVTGQLDEAARCQQVCDLAAISCGLGDQICELADRHPGEQDYVSACERANVDCEAAKEACDACAE
jgi:hypothetical protein